MNSATKVGEIFTAAGQAFNRLGELTMQLHPSSTDTSSGKWTDEEIEMLHSSISRFTEDLYKISLRIKNRTVSQIRQTLKKKAFDDAGIPAKHVPMTQQIQQTSSQQQQPLMVQQTQSASSQQQKQAQQQQTVQIQHVQQIVQVPQQQQQQQQRQQQQQTRQQVVQNQTTTKQIIIQQSPQQSQPQIVHIQTQPQQQQTQQVVQQQQQAVTLQQLQQLQKTATETIVSDSVVGTNSSGLMGSKSADVMMTLNRLNTQENEVDVECLPTDVKLEFTSDEVAG